MQKISAVDSEQMNIVDIYYLSEYAISLKQSVRFQ